MAKESEKPENRMSRKGSDERKGHQSEKVENIVGSSVEHGIRFTMPDGHSPMTGGAESGPSHPKG